MMMEEDDKNSVATVDTDPENQQEDCTSCNRRWGPICVNNQQQESSTLQKKKYLIVGGLLSLMVFAGGIGLGLGLSGNKNSKNDNKTVESSNGGEDIYKPVDEPAPPVSLIEKFISKFALNGGGEFKDKSSYQSKALAWLERNTLIETYSHDQTIQRYALACLYFSTHGVSNFVTDQELDGQTPPGWKRSDDWMSDTNECSWYGIKCDLHVVDASTATTKSIASAAKNMNGVGSVIEINLYKNRMTGIFPPEISLLSNSLVKLELGDNDYLMGGDIDDDENGNVYNNEWLGQMKELKYFYHPFCKFHSRTGIPTEMAMLTNLQEYDAAYNIYQGPLDGKTFEPLQKLEWLDISGGYFESSIPTQLLTLPKLEELFIDDSFIIDDVSYLTHLSQLYQHVADRNPGITGKLPDASSISENLVVLSFSNCGLSGTIPPSFGDIQDLQGLYLNNNQITGTVPSDLAKLSILNVLELQGNDITGAMPSEICSNVNSGSALDDGTITSLIADCNGEVDCPLDTCCTSCDQTFDN